jgi:hypothetical protein
VSWPRRPGGRCGCPTSPRSARRPSPTGPSRPSRSPPAADLATASVDADELAADSVRAPEIADNSIDGGEVVDGGLQARDVATFAGIAAVDFVFSSQTCAAVVVAASSTSAQPQTIADEVIVVTPDEGWPDAVMLSASPVGTGEMRLVACRLAGAPSTVHANVRYAAFDL